MTLATGIQQQCVRVCAKVYNLCMKFPFSPLSFLAVEAAATAHVHDRNTVASVRDVREHFEFDMFRHHFFSLTTNMAPDASDNLSVT